LPSSIEDAQPVTVALPPVVYRFEQGHRLLLTVASSDQAYATPDEPAIYTIALDDSATTIALPTITGEPIPDPEVVWRYVLAVVAGAIALGILTALVIARLR